MTVTVSVNDRTVIHRGSEGHTRDCSDVCKTPKSGDPVPYTNVSLSKDAADSATSVLSDGCADHGRMRCFRGALGMSRWAAMPATSPWPGRRVSSYDPFFPGLYVEPSFHRMGKPAQWDVVFSGQDSAWHTDADGNPLPLPAGEWLPGTNRPDAGIARDPKKPLGRDNLTEIYEIKFPGDPEDEDQLARYQKMNRAVPVHTLTAEKCNCKDRRTRRRVLERGPVEEIVPHPERAPQPKPAPPVELPPDLAPPIPPATPVTPGRELPKLDPQDRPKVDPVPDPRILPKLKDVLKRLPRTAPGVPVLPPVFLPPKPPPEEA